MSPLHLKNLLRNLILLDILIFRNNILWAKNWEKYGLFVFAKSQTNALICVNVVG